MTITTVASLARHIRAENARLDSCLRRKVGIRLQTYKLIMAFARLAGVIGGIVAIQNGADPMAALIVMGGIVMGPDFLEIILTTQE